MPGRKRDRAAEILEEAEGRAKVPRSEPKSPVMVTPRELSEEAAVDNWCQNISMDCIISPEENRGKSDSTDELLGESNNSQHLPPPTSSSSSLEEPTHLPMPPKPSLPLESPPEGVDCCIAHVDASEEVDCRVSEGQDCSVSPEGTSLPPVSHQAVVQSVTKAFGAWILFRQGSLTGHHISRLATEVLGA
eukprot:scaffold25412_cov37-Cyclotella_meneghiniana.AAC.3